MPKDVSFVHTSLSKFGRNEDNAISCIVNQNQLLIWKFHEDTLPVSYTFSDSCGGVVAHAWQDMENIIVGFFDGSLALISMAEPDAGKVHETSKLNEIIAIIEVDDVDSERDSHTSARTFTRNPFACSLGWSDDGQLMGVVSPRSILHVFINHFGTIMCIRVVSERIYPEPVSKIKLSGNYVAAAIAGGRVILHWIEPANFPAKMQSPIRTEGGHCQAYGRGKSEVQSPLDKLEQERTFPESGERVVDFDLTDSLLSYSTDSGNLYQFHVGEWAIVNTYEHYCPITSLTSTKSGRVLAFTDAQHSAYIFNSAFSTLVEVPNSPVDTSRILWNSDDCENPLLMAVSKDFLVIYRYFAASILLSEEECARQGREMLLSSTNPVALNCSQSSVGGTNGNMNLLALEKKPSQAASTQRHVLSSRRAAYGECRLLDRMRLPPNYTPLGFFAEDVCFLTQSGGLAHATLPSHTFRNYTKSYAKTFRAGPDSASDNDLGGRGTEQVSSHTKLEKFQGEKSKLLDDGLITHFENALNAGAFEDALILSDLIQLPLRWHQLARACTICLEFDIAIQAFRRLNDCASVLVIQRLMNIEEKQLLYGYVCMFLGDFNHAQEFFLASSKPEAALEMRRDLLHWDAALQLARSLQPHEIPFISREYAFELECVGDYVNALMYYERALERPNISDRDLDHSTYEAEATVLLNGGCAGFGDWKFDEWDEHVAICNAGVVRNTIRLGDYKRGLAMVLRSPSLALKKECASILEQARQWPEAATLHEAAGQVDAAIAVYLKSKNYKRAGELLCTTKASCQLYLEYAKARESSGAYVEAISAYESAKDWESVVRLTLDKMNNPTAAVKVVRETKSVGAAKAVAQYFAKVGDFASAIQFLVLSKCNNAAYELALKHRKMEVYASVIGRDGSPDEYKSIAVHFECERNSLLAGKFFLYAKQYAKAVRHLLRVPHSDTSSALDLAIEAVGEARDKKLTNMVITYLTGEADGITKDLRHLFRLYMALRQYRDAARTAVIVAREEQSSGKYRSAHDLLFSMVQELRQQHIKVPAEMLDNLSLLHSYVLAKFHAKFGNHMIAARLLIRIAQNISKFPSHIVPILSSTVIECQKVNLKYTSFTYASTLLRAEYKEKIDPRYRRRFEGIVRRPEKLSSEEAETLNSASPCPFCSDAVAEYELTCGSCRTHLPYCILTGKHVVREDVALCPNCDFPMTYTTLMSYIENQPDLACQMCSVPLVRDDIRRLVDAVEVLLRWNTGLFEPEVGTRTPTAARDADIIQDKTFDETSSNEPNTS
ncbi:hypothetical protein TcWFU_004852 [Taenia crassiceps]|uniref:WDR19 WD40 repeat domain-containing protein n=1 Tax=Taenia crassiceps TaxID=6207 RepID=A0ABR4QKV1_9CEST